MDYKKKYENALEWARQVINGECGFIRKEVEEVFPELKESEDEKVRKAIVELVLQSSEILGSNNQSRMLAWLEKQGNNEQILANSAKTCKVEPKFKIKDWITNGKLTCKVLSVTGKSYELHLYNDDYCHFETDIQSVDKDYHLWTVKDAKKGDVLHSTGWHNDCIFIFNGLDNWKFDEPNGGKAVATGYCCLFVSADKIEFGMQGPDCIEVDTVKPAIKIQRDLLFSKMKEAGWSWNPTTKELSQSRVTKISDQEWSEEDEE